jgi:hypothetical protein
MAQPYADCEGFYKRPAMVSIARAEKCGTTARGGGTPRQGGTVTRRRP